MVINDNLRKSVVFVAVKTVDDEYRFKGTAFYVGVSLEGTPHHHMYLVTARHVIEGIRSLGADIVYLRVNLKGGTSTWVSVPIVDWVFHPTDANVDVAVLIFRMPQDWDHLLVPEKLFLTKETVERQGMGIGDEVIITGLFKHHIGEKRNIPICRVGNLAALNEEMIVTEKYGSIEAYLIEARSIGGLSGSPVFVHFGTTRTIKGGTVTSAANQYALLGLIHGHFDVVDGLVDIGTNPGTAVSQINTGIGIVIPYFKIKEVLDQPSFAEKRKQVTEVARAKKIIS